ncbi:MAG: RHS repeat-associated core domain-containing protein [Blastocatellia bacterium]
MLLFSYFEKYGTVVRLKTIGLILLCLFGVTDHTYAQYDKTAGVTPSLLTPGTPAGTYPLEGFDTVNLYNGNMNFSLPLLTIKGRGSVSHTINLRIEQRWQLDGYFASQGIYTPMAHWWTGIEPGYGPGTMEGRYLNDPCGDPVYSGQQITRLYFTTPDGTEIEFRDQESRGETKLGNCYPHGIYSPTFNRKKIFNAVDGSAATFISDTDIYDWNGIGDTYIFPTGNLMWRDGTMYRIVNGQVSWMRDRNGNRLECNGNVFKDSLNREVTITTHPQSPAPNYYDKITYRGNDGAIREIKIWYKPLEDILRADYQVGTAPYTRTYDQLFGLGSSQTRHNPLKAASVELPNGKSYQFYYNPYGELARVVLPTGGAYEYDWMGYISGNPDIIRRVAEKRVYPTGGQGTAFSVKTIFSDNQTPTGTNSWFFTEQRDAANNLLAHSKHYFYYNSVSSTYLWTPFQNRPYDEGRENKTEVYNTSGSNVSNMLRETSQVWTASFWGAAPSSDTRISEKVTTLSDISPNLVSKETYSYDAYNNKTDIYEYNFGAGNYGTLIRRTHTDYVTTNNSANYATATNIHLRGLPSVIQVFDANNIKRAESLLEYDNYNQSSSDVFHAALIPRNNISGLDSIFTTSYYNRGNVTKTTQNLLDVNGNVTSSIYNHAQYDIAGNVVKTVDPRSTTSNLITTTFEFDDRFGYPNGEAQSNSTPPAPGSTWLNGQTTYAFPTKVTNALGHIAYTQVDYFLGKPVDTEDANNIKGSLYYIDAFDRPTKGIRAVGTALQNQTLITYDDTNRIVTTTTDKDANTDGALQSKAFYDGLGRLYRKATYEGTIPGYSQAQWAIVETHFDALGRVYRRSNPFRDASPIVALPGNAEWTTSTFDALSRVLTVTAPDNTVATTSYIGNEVLAIDQAGKQRKSESDAVGRLVKVWEAPNDPTNFNYLTTYAYDTLDNLTTVTQGAQTRTFVYDSLKRLKQVTNPESGTTTYTYDNNFNLLTKLDANSITTTYAYDALNRNTTTNYSNTAITPDLTRSYDGATTGKGQYWESYAGGDFTNGSNVEYQKINAYDVLGRPLSVTQRQKLNGTWSASLYTTARTYNLAGNVLSQTYPSGKVVNYSYDQAARLTSFTGQLGGITGPGNTDISYANNIKYNARSQMIRETFGTTTNLYHRNYYNRRGQLFDARLGTDSNTAYDVENPVVWRWATGTWNRGAIRLNYSSTGNDYEDYTTTNGALVNNNGNVYRMDHFIPDNDSVTSWKMNANYYNYDALNRLQWVQENQVNNGAETVAYKQTNSYDRWGNRTIDQSNTWAMDGNVWVEDSLPSSAVAVGDNDGWNWVTAAPTPFSGSSSHQSSTVAGVHQHYFYGATNTLTLTASDSLYAWVYLDPTNPPTEVMLQWNNGDWEHRAYWGADQIGWGVNNTNSRRYVGALPATGGWVRLEVPASAVGLVGSTLNGMAFTLYGGKATWDRAGKTALIGGGINKEKYTVDATNNRFTELTYYASGAVKGEKTTGTGRMEYQYDAENRVIAYGYNIVTTPGNPVTSRYFYDADGNRTRKIVSGTETWFVYGLDGELVAEYNANGAVGSPQKEYGYRSGQLLVVYDTTETTADKKLQWMVTDHLGTPRMVIDKTGSLSGVKRHDYLPFGEELGAGVGLRSAGNGYTADQVRQKFTGYERDTETGLDYAQARMYANVQGRFTSPDPLLESGRPEDAQSWNRYAYARNNPLAYIDPTGLNYEHLKGRQKDLIDQWAAAQNKANKTNISAEAMYNGLTESQRSTYESVTHAMMNTQLKDDKGNSLGNALDAVQSITSIAGDSKDGGAPKDAKSDQQFRVYVEIKSGKELIAGSVQFDSGRNKGGLHEGYPLSFRLKGGVPSLQVSMSEDFRRGDNDVDYLPKWHPLHLTKANSDIRDGNNYKNHTKRFGPGLVNWWEKKKKK